MPIKYEIQTPVDFEDWLEENGITVVVKERPRYISEGIRHKPERYYATSEPSYEVTDYSIRSGVHGNGDNPLAAIEDLKRQWRGVILVTGWGENRKEIVTPNEWK